MNEAAEPLPEGLPDIQPLTRALDVADRITAQFSMIFEQKGEDPVQSIGNFSQLVPQSDEGAYQRRMKAVPEGRLLIAEDCWIDNPGFVVITNRAGADLQDHPTAEQKKEIEASIIKIHFFGGGEDNFLIIPPGATLPFYFGRGSIALISGPNVKCRVTVFPGK